MDSNKLNKSVNTLLKKRFINGKSYKYLLELLTLEGFGKADAIEKLNSLNKKFGSQRLKMAKKDLLISMIFISIPLLNFLVYYFNIIENFRYKFSIIDICSLFAFGAFFISYYKVIRDKNKF